MNNFDCVLKALQDGKVIVYPTEGVFGLGCDPDDVSAIQHVLALKQRSVEKGLILIASSYQQLQPYIDETQLTQSQLAQVMSSWPGFITWIMPANAHVSKWLQGQFKSIAVRVTDHPLIQQLCHEFGKPIVSTSANITGQPPCTNLQDAKHQWSDQPVTILHGETGGRCRPSEIRDAKTLQLLRKG